MSPKPNPELIEEARHHLSQSEEITDPNLKTRIRLYETTQALASFSKSIQVKLLDLEFYQGKKEITPNDTSLVSLELNKGINSAMNKKSKLALFIAHPVDAHQTHRIVSDLFIEEAKKLSSKFPHLEIDLVYYDTPWSGDYNLYLFTEQGNGSKAQALIGAERINALGQSSRKFLEGFDWGQGKNALTFNLEYL